MLVPRDRDLSDESSVKDARMLMSKVLLLKSRSSRLFNLNGLSEPAG